MKILQPSTNLYTQSNKVNKNYELPARNNNISFNGVPTANITKSKFAETMKKIFTPIGNAFNKYIKKPYRNFMEPKEEKIAKDFAKLIQKPAARKLIEFTAEKGNFGNKLFSHLLVLGSTLLSGFYVIKTLKNDKLDEQKRNTLAINQTAVFVVSTILAYTFDVALGNKTKNIQTKFRNLNTIKNDKTHNDMIENCVKGIDAAKKIMIFTTMYRFIAPVLVTPLANLLGNKLQETKEAKLALGSKN